MKISQRAFLTRSHFSNQSSLKSPLEHETRNTWNFQAFFQNLIMPSDYHVFLFITHKLSALNLHCTDLASSLPRNDCCVGIKRSHWTEVIKSICSLVLLAQRGLRVSRLAKLPDTFQSHTGPLFSLLGAQRGDGKGGRGVAHYIGSPESPRRQHAIWTHSLLINRAALVNRVELNVMIVNNKTDSFNRVSVYFDTLWYLVSPALNQCLDLY